MIRRYPFTALIAFVILILSIIHLDRAPKLELQHGDKFGHLLAYGVLSGTWLIEYARSNRWSNTAPLWSIVIITSCIIYGILLEWLQSSGWVQRNFDYYDMLANTLGVLLGFVVFRLNRQRFAQLLK